MATARLFITATGTSSGKTFLTRGLAAALHRNGHRVAAIKPLETGCEPQPHDAIALAKAAGHPELANDPSFFRAAPPLSPYAASLSGAGTPDFAGIVGHIEALADRYDCVLIEGAGGLLVPLDQRRDMADLAAALACPLVVVAPNRLGVLSHARATIEAARNRHLEIAALVLTEPDNDPDPSATTNLRILRERLDIPLVRFPFCEDRDAELANAVDALGLLQLLHL